MLSVFRRVLGGAALYSRLSIVKRAPPPAVGIACPAVLTADLADSCNSYITSVVLAHDIVPRFSIYNVFVLREKMVRWVCVLWAALRRRPPCTDLPLSPLCG